MRFRTSIRGRRMLLGLLAGGLAILAGCSLDDLVGDELPPTTIDPKLFQTDEGALALYRGSIWAFRRGFGGANGSYVLVSGRMTDELTTGAYADPGATFVLQKNSLAEIDSRTMPEDELLRSSWVESWYRDLNMARNQAVDAIYYLRNFAHNLPSNDLISHMYSIRGLAMVLLADMFCSGIPLTDYLPGGGLQYRPGSTTEEVYTAAVAQFDSALASVEDSTRYRYLAQVGKARALLNLGLLTEAAQVVADVPTSFKYEALYAEDYDGSFSNNYVWGIRDYMDPETTFGTIADREGINGLPFVSSHDPRIPLVPAPRQSTTYPLTTYMLPAWMLPNRPPWNGLSTESGKNGEDITVASGIEARLIEAEAAAAAGNPAFLTILNTLRTTCTDAASCPTPAPAGTGGVGGLPPLTDPGSTDARLKLVFDERAYWLFLTGQRQGDLRRMVRVHGYAQEDVYPAGFFVYGGAYGPFTNLPIPHTERAINTRYTGCYNRDA